MSVDPHRLNTIKLKDYFRFKTNLLLNTKEDILNNVGNQTVDHKLFGKTDKYLDLCVLHCFVCLWHNVDFHKNYVLQGQFFEGFKILQYF